MTRNIIPHRQLPLIEEYWAWNTMQTASDAPTSPLIRSFLANSNAYDQESVDGILTAIRSRMPERPGTVMIAGGSSVGASAPPTEKGRAAARELRAHGWKIATN